MSEMPTTSPGKASAQGEFEITCQVDALGQLPARQRTFKLILQLLKIVHSGEKFVEIIPAPVNCFPTTGEKFFNSGSSAVGRHETRSSA